MIEVEHLCKTFTVSRRDAGIKQAVSALFRRETEKIRALDDVSFRIEAGEMVGYIGPNGAGKSSTIKVMSAGQRYLPDQWPRAMETAQRTCQPDWRCIWTAQSAVVGYSCH